MSCLLLHLHLHTCALAHSLVNSLFNPTPHLLSLLLDVGDCVNFTLFLLIRKVLTSEARMPAKHERVFHHIDVIAGVIHRAALLEIRDKQRLVQFHLCDVCAPPPLPLLEPAPSEARLCAFLTEHESNKRAKRIGWVSLVVDLAVCSHFAHFVASMYARLPKGSLASLAHFLTLSKSANHGKFSISSAPSGVPRTFVLSLLPAISPAHIKLHGKQVLIPQRIFSNVLPFSYPSSFFSWCTST